MNRNLMPVSAVCVFILSICAACDDSTMPYNDNPTPGDSILGYFEETVAEALVENTCDHEEGSDYAWPPEDVVHITLGGNSIAVDGTGATVEGTVVTIDSAGTYEVSGSLADGRLIVDAPGTEIVRLILDGADINCSTSSPLCIYNALKTIIVLADLSENHLSDGATYVFDYPDEKEPNAALFSRSDLTICGGGSLAVEGHYKGGIAVKAGLIVRSGSITVNAAGNGIKGGDYVVVKGGETGVAAGGDGIKSDGADEDNGYFYVESGAINIVSAEDGVQAESDALVAGGSIDIVSGGGSGFTVGEDESAKGIKAGVRLIIDGGAVSIDSAEDGLRSGERLVINGGGQLIACSDDGIQSDFTIGMNGATTDITKCTEGVESPLISISGGEIRIESSDDGLNAAKSDANYLYISGGYVYVNAYGDAIDANGSILMTGGTVIVNGPSLEGDAAIDYDETFGITGGFLLAVGSPGMAQGPDKSSTQYSVIVRLGMPVPAGTLINMRTSEGEDLFTFSPTKSYASTVFSSPDLEKGAVCTLYYGGGATGDETDGLYEGGAYTPGTVAAVFAISEIVTIINID